MSSYPPGFENDDGLRSDFIRQLTLKQLERDGAASIEESTGQAELIPRTLVRYWHDPHGVPSDVRGCLDSWEALREEGFSMRMYNDASARTYIGNGMAGAKSLVERAMRSDYLRMCFVLAEGGLYVDADDVLLGEGWREIFRGAALKVQPLCYDVRAGCMVSATELRRIDLPTDDRIFYVKQPHRRASWSSGVAAGFVSRD